MKKYVYVFVRRDLKPEQRAVQACHAALESGVYFGCRIPNQTTLVLLGVKNEGELLAALSKVKGANIKYVAFTEPDLNGQHTALATEAVGEDQRWVFRDYRTLRYERGVLYYLKVLWRSLKREVVDE